MGTPPLEGIYLTLGETYGDGGSLSGGAHQIWMLDRTSFWRKRAVSLKRYTIPGKTMSEGCKD
jgi:hypothetical protein